MNEEFEQNVPETAQEKDLDAERNDIQNEEPVNEPENASAPEQETRPFDLNDELNSGIHSMLYRRITGFSTSIPVIKTAFERFIDSAEVGGSFSVYDLIFGCESILNRREVSAENGDRIFCYNITGDGRYPEKLLKRSVSGIYALFGLRNGMEIDINAAGGSIAAAESKRFAVVPERKAAKTVAKAASYGIQLIPAGSILADDKIIIRSCEDGMIAGKSFLENGTEGVLNLDDTCLESFINGSYAACGYSTCRRVTNKNLLRFGLGGSLAEVCARALGYFSSMMYLKETPVNIVFTSENRCTVAVARPEVADGDYLYLLKVRSDPDGMPDKIHHGQLNFYVRELVKSGTIKYVLPVKENVGNALERLAGDKYEFVQLEEIPDRCFGVIAGSSRGESVNGTKLGYFKTGEGYQRSPEE